MGGVSVCYVMRDAALMSGVECRWLGSGNLYACAPDSQMNPAGEKLNPNHHEAIAEVPDANKDAGTVAQVFKDGYANVLLLSPQLCPPTLCDVVWLKCLHFGRGVQVVWGGWAF
jgi:hypothetical protein